MSAHTPGPWFVSLNYGHMTGVRAENADIGRWVANAWCQTSTPQSAAAHAKQVDQNEANARLIAAAPELLDALCLAHDYLAGNGWDFDPRMAPIRGAIAKATGEAA